jgi:Protein of unknown function (DUF3987)
VDWISSYFELTEGLPTPPVFRLWSGIFAMAACMERRTWLRTAYGLTYPNMFILLAAPSGSGKSPAIKPARTLLYRSKSVVVAADDMTKAAFLDEMSEHSKRVLYKGETIIYNPLCVMISELGTLINAHDLEFFSLLSDLFDNKDDPHRSRRRGHNSGKALELPNPSINILAGTQPAFLGDLLPDAAWHQGFTGRMLMIYAPGAPEDTDMFAEQDDRAPLAAELTKGIVMRSKLLGQFSITDEAKDRLRLWFSSGMKPVPEHDRLTTYRAKRNQFVLKLCMVAAVSARCELCITLDDVERAKSWLLAAESVMPDIFRDMQQKSDSLLLGELHRFAFDLWVKSAPTNASERKAIHRSKLMEFLALKCPADKAHRVLELACQMGWIEPVADTLLYVPKVRGYRVEEN